MKRKWRRNPVNMAEFLKKLRKIAKSARVKPSKAARKRIGKKLFAAIEKKKQSLMRFSKPCNCKWCRLMREN
jgi:hypothetical protein